MTLDEFKAMSPAEMCEKGIFEALNLLSKKE